MAYVRKVPVGAAQGLLAQIYAAARQRAGKVFEILQVQSLQPAVLQAFVAMYQAVMLDPRGPLPRWFRELLAVSVSRLNRCRY
jgi:alkylhydroperoxidase family enzyme